MTDTRAADAASEAETETDLDAFLGSKPRSKRRTWMIRGLIGLGLLALLYLVWSCSSGSDQPSYTTRDVRRGDLTVTVSATGNLKPINQIDIGSEQSGLITKVTVDVNDRVGRGQVLAELDTSRLQDTVNQNRSQVAAAQAGVAQAHAQLALARATLSRQEEVYRLSGGRVPSRTELDTARANFRQAQASVRSAEAQVQVANAQLSSAQTSLSKARIVSPVNGVVLSRNIEPGQTVASGLNVATLFTIAEDLTRMEVEVSVDEADVGQVKDGQDATFTVDAFPGRTFPARITRVNVGSNASTASSTTSAAGTVVAYTAVLSVDNPDETLRPGMTATADIVTKRLSNVLLVPNAALRFSPQAAGGQKSGGIASQLGMGPRRMGNRAPRSVTFGAGSRQTVYVLGADGKPQPVSVIVGDSDGARSVVIGGDLKEGMKVITGQLAAGETAPTQDQGADSRSERGQGRDKGGTGGTPAVVPSAPPVNGTPPAGNPRAPAANASVPAMPAGNRTSANATTAAPADATQRGDGAAWPGGARLRAMTPEQRKAFFESLTPEQREAFRKRREARQNMRQQAGEAVPSDAP